MLRNRLPDTRQSVSHRVCIAGLDVYLIVGLYEDGRPGELFIHTAKAGSTLHGMMDTMAILTSLLLQTGTPVSKLAEKFTGVGFEPAGWTDNPEMPRCTSLPDYVFRWMEARWPS